MGWLCVWVCVCVPRTVILLFYIFILSVPQPKFCFLTDTLGCKWIKIRKFRYEKLKMDANKKIYIGAMRIKIAFDGCAHTYCHEIISSSKYLSTTCAIFIIACSHACYFIHLNENKSRNVKVYNWHFKMTFWFSVAFCLDMNENYYCLLILLDG